MDVPGKVEINSIVSKLLVALYQLYLIFAFLIGRKVGDAMTKRLSLLMKHNPPYFKRIHSGNNFPYYYFWRNKVRSLLKLEQPFLKSYTPSVPVVYLYGSVKPFFFHGDKWLNWLKNTPNCECHVINAGHWFMRPFKKFVIECIRKRLQGWLVHGCKILFICKF